MAKILVIDDDAEILRSIALFLQAKRHEVVTAVDGMQGIRQMEFQKFDLVITDIFMPEQDGIGVLIWLLSQTRIHPKIIVISGGIHQMDHARTRDMCKKLYADRVLPKPLDFEALEETVSELLRGDATNNNSPRERHIGGMKWSTYDHHTARNSAY